MIAGAAEILLQLMIDRGILVESINNAPAKWQGAIGPLPPDPPNILGFIDTVPWQQGRIQRTGERIEHPELQIMLRSQNYQIGLDKGKDISLNFLDKIGVRPEDDAQGLGVLRTTVNSIQYTVTAVFIKVALNYLGEEKDTRRCLFSINLQMEYHSIT